MAHTTRSICSWTNGQVGVLEFIIINSHFIWQKTGCYFPLLSTEYSVQNPEPTSDYLGRSATALSARTTVCRVVYSNDVTWPPWHLKSPTTRLLIQQLLQACSTENTKSPHWGMWVGYIGQVSVSICFNVILISDGLKQRQDYLISLTSLAIHFRISAQKK